VDNQLGIIRLSRNIGFFAVGYEYMIQLIPVVIVAPLFLSGEITDWGEVTKAMAAFAMVIGAFSLVVKEFAKISLFRAVTERLGGACEAIADGRGGGSDGGGGNGGGPDGGKPPVIEIVEGGDRLAYDRVTLLTPRDGRVLIRDLSLEVPQGKHLLIVGPDGV